MAYFRSSSNLTSLQLFKIIVHCYRLKSLLALRTPAFLDFLLAAPRSTTYAPCLSFLLPASERFSGPWSFGFYLYNLYLRVLPSTCLENGSPLHQARNLDTVTGSSHPLVFHNHLGHQVLSILSEKPFLLLVFSCYFQGRCLSLNLC